MGQDGLLVGYARVSTDEQDIQSQRDGLVRLGVSAERIYVDHGRTGSNRDRSGLREAMAAVRTGDTLVVTKLDRLARSVKDAAELVEELTASGARLSIAGSIHDPADPVGKLLFNVLSMVAEFERDLIRARTREGMAVARARGRLKGRQPKLSPAQQKQVIRLMDEGEQTPTEIGELFGVSRQTVYRMVAKARKEHAA